MKVYTSMSKMHEFILTATVAIAHGQPGGDWRDVSGCPGKDILEKWAQELKKHAVAMGFTVIDIYGSDLTYEPMTQILQVTKPAVLFYFGLGDKSHLIGTDMRPVLTSDKEKDWIPYANGMLGNLQSVAGTAVIAYSSLAAQQLGSELIKAGSPCFVGFSDQLIVVSDKYGTENIFKDSLLPLAERILQGWTVGAAVEATRSDLLNAVRQQSGNELITTDEIAALRNSPKLISVPLFANRKCLTYFGDPNWKLRRNKS